MSQEQTPIERRLEKIEAELESLPEVMRAMHDKTVEDLTEVMRTMQTELLRGFAAFAGMVWGRNVHPHKGINGGLTWHFRTGRGAVAPSTNLAPRAGIRDRSKPLPH